MHFTIFFPKETLPVALLFLPDLHCIYLRHKVFKGRDCHLLNDRQPFHGVRSLSSQVPCFLSQPGCQAGRKLTLFPGYQPSFTLIPSYSNFRIMEWFELEGTFKSFCSSHLALEQPLVLDRSNLCLHPRGERVRWYRNLEDLFTCMGKNPSCWAIDASGPLASFGKSLSFTPESVL